MNTVNLFRLMNTVVYYSFVTTILYGNLKLFSKIVMVGAQRYDTSLERKYDMGIDFVMLNYAPQELFYILFLCSLIASGFITSTFLMYSLNTIVKLSEKKVIF